MTQSMRRINAILIKEIQDIKTNMNILLMYVLPVVIVVLYRNFLHDMPTSFITGFGLLFLVVMVGMYVPSMLIAEEKEKRTLEVLMLSPAKPIEIFVGKGLLTFISMMIAALVILFASGNGLAHIDVILTGTVLTALVSIFIGMIVGLLSPNQMSTGLVGTPIYMFLIFVPLFSQMGEGVMQIIARFVPTYYYFNMLELALDKGQGLSHMKQNIGMLLIGIMAALILLLLVYERKGMGKSS